MQTTEFIPEADDIAILAFRLAWPGEAVPCPVTEPRLRLAARLIPAKLRRRFATRRQALTGWPVALSAPSAESGRSWLPSVKLTGRPLD